MDKIIKLKKGMDIKLAGKPAGFIKDHLVSATVAIKPTDFLNIKPKLEVNVGDEVKAGQTLFHHKLMPEVKFSAPVSGEIVEIKRGAKRVIEEIVILADKKTSYLSFEIKDKNNAENVKEAMLNSGAWIHIRQRPFNAIANPEATPKGIFISGFNSAPLSADVNFLLGNNKEDFQAGIDALNTLTAGNVNLGLPYDTVLCPALKEVKNVNKYYFDGPHPAGNVGVQIHHINPINKGDVVFTVSPEDVLIIGRLMNKGIYDASKVVALAGSSFNDNNYIQTVLGASIKTLTENNLKEGDNRIISGNILSGTKISQDSYLGFYDNSLTAIPEGAESEFLGWLLPSYERPSASRAFVWLQRLFTPGVEKGYEVNANMHGEERAYVVTGEYDKVMPMDILPTQLVKSIMANDIDSMENLGIYELVEEDLALCEFVCTSKIPVQNILRKGLNFIEKEA